ncbi:MAG: endonuclease/exonuclease/phosphatase family protein [Bacteroidales bacterium]|nr:endonuclease/exonuclease/phosphatase family protein [Bacteroidales bacterium]
MENRERGFLGKLMVFVLSIMAFVGLLAMALSVINAYINPQHFIWTTMFGLAFWEILIYNVLILFFLLMLKSRKAWISVLALIVAIPGFGKSYSMGKKVEADNSIRIMSYNVHQFKHVDGETDRESFANQVINMVREQNPDILCCQEFEGYISKMTRPKCIELFAEGAGFQYVYYNRKSNYGGNVVFSKYPIAKVSEDSGFGKENTYGVMVSVNAGEKGLFHVANVHLLSYMITDSEIEVLTNTSERQNLDTIGKTVLHKLSYAFQKRSEELKDVLEGMPPIEGPIIVCGDFNEPPLSYNYRQMQKAGFVDTFTKVGRGIKPTYAGKLPLLRIDYVWANDGVTPLNFKRYRYKASDHYPIMLDFKIK